MQSTRNQKNDADFFKKEFSNHFPSLNDTQNFQITDAAVHPDDKENFHPNIPEYPNRKQSLSIKGFQANSIDGSQAKNHLMSLEHISASDNTTVQKAKNFLSKFDVKQPCSNGPIQDSAIYLSDMNKCHEDMCTEMQIDMEDVSNIRNLTNITEWKEPREDSCNNLAIRDILNSVNSEPDLNEDTSMSEESTQYFLITAKHSVAKVEDLQKSHNLTEKCNRQRANREDDNVSRYSEPNFLAQNHRNEGNDKIVSSFNPYLSNSGGNKDILPNPDQLKNGNNFKKTTQISEIVNNVHGVLSLSSGVPCKSQDNSAKWAL